MQQNNAGKKIILINRDFQLKYTGIAAGVGLITTILSGLVILGPLYVFEILRIPNFLPLPILSGMGVALLVNILALSYVGVHLTHRIAGPMYSIVRHLRRMAAGRWALPMRIRDEDELKFVVRNINDLVFSLKEIAITDLRDINSAIAALEALGPASSQLQSAITTLDELKQRIIIRLENTEGNPA